MTISIDGTTLIWTGTVTVTNATDLSTGVCTLQLTPQGGVGILPFLAQGNPGMPALISPTVTVTTLTAGASATASLTQTSAGGPGTNSQYTLALGLPRGAAGASGTMTIGGAAVSGTNTDQYTLIYSTADSEWIISPQLIGDTFQATSFTAASGNSSPQNLASITVPAQLFNWRPDVKGSGTPTGTANTHVDLRCVVGNPTSGQQVGYGTGLTGAGSGSIPALPITLQQAFGGAISGGYGVINAGSAATFYFQAIQTATTTDSFSVPTTPNMYFTVKVDPIPGTQT